MVGLGAYLAISVVATLMYMCLGGNYEEDKQPETKWRGNNEDAKHY